MKIYEKDLDFVRVTIQNQLQVEEEKEKSDYNRGVVDALKWILENPLSV